jgi:hypothetical protein
MAAGSVAIAGCASSDHYNAQRDQIAAWERVETARAQAEARRWDALANAARDADPATRLAVAITLGSGQGAQQQQRAPLPQVTDPSETALRWTQALAGPVVNLAAVGFGAWTAVTQSDNAAATAISSNQTMLGLGSVGVAGMRDVSIAGFRALPQLTPNTTTTNTYTITGSAIAQNGSTAALDNSRRCSPAYPWTYGGNPTQPVTVPWSVSAFTC